MLALYFGDTSWNICHLLRRFAKNTFKNCSWCCFSVKHATDVPHFPDNLVVNPFILLREAVDEAITDTDRRIFSQSESSSEFLLSVTHASHLCSRQLDNQSSALTGLLSNGSGHVCVCALHSGKVLCCLP